MSNSTVKLGYWKIRGLAEPIRLILEYCGVAYDNVFYEVGPAPEYSRESWFSVKPNLGLGPFANLPYYIDGELKFVESNAIINHLARKYNLDGEREEDKIRCDVMLYHLSDIMNARFTMMCYNPKFEELRAAFMKSLPEYLRQFAEYLGDNKYFAGNKITKVDFIAYEFFARMAIFAPGCLDSYPTLSAYLKTIEDLPAIKAYHSSDRFFKRPINNPSAKWL